MVSPTFATIVVLSFLLVFGLLIPVLNRVCPKYVSYRWSVVVVILALLIGVVIDFGELSDETRRSLIIGGLIIAGGYVALRTAEKTLANGWLRGASIEAKKGDVSVTVRGGQGGGKSGS